MYKYKITTMARPKKFNAEYFTHDVDMRNDIKIRNIRRNYGHEGYSLWIMLLEHLGNCDYFEYKWTDDNIELLEPDFDMDADRIKEIVNRMIHLDLLQIMNGMLTCDRFSKRLFENLSLKRDSFLIENSIRYKLEKDKLEKDKLVVNGVKSSYNPTSTVQYSKAQNSGVYDSILHNRIVKDSIGNFSDNLLNVEDSPLGGESIRDSEYKELNNKIKILKN